jgi:hypothetical protein
MAPRRKTKPPTPEQLAAREKAAADRAAADAARPVNTIKVTTRGRNKPKFTRDGTVSNG